MYTILSISTRSISEIDTKKWKGSTHLKIEKFDSFSLFSSPRFTLAVERPSRLLRRKTHPSPSNAARTSFFPRRMHVCWFMRSSLCEKSVKTGHVFPTFNLNIRRVFYLRPWMGQVCSDAEKKEDDTYRWPLIFHGKEC